jgi:diaminohydroxyphosphoribosylaminopyrimidine deaminase/5-amino-6-(5-phosphoribosylamino)uracil reductase
MTTSERFMARALELARKGWGLVNPNPMVGALLVRDGRVIGEGWHTRFGAPHAEIEAFRSASAAGESIRGCTLYVTLEPCSHQGKTPPCTEAVIREGVLNVVAGMTDPNPLVSGRGFAALRGSGIKVTEGILEKECRQLNEPFVTFQKLKRPHVLYKAACSLDGKTATGTGESRWISGPESREEAHRLRAGRMSILAGIGTILADDPLLTSRWSKLPGKKIIRIAADPAGKIPLESKLVKTASEQPFWLACTGRTGEDKAKQLADRGVRVVRFDEGSSGGVDPAALLGFLYTEGIDSVLLEGGSTLAGSFFKARLVDRIAFFMAPLLVGGREAPGLFAGGFDALDKVPELVDREVIPFGRDLCLTGRCVYR